MSTIRILNIEVQLPEECHLHEHCHEEDCHNHTHCHPVGRPHGHNHHGDETAHDLKIQEGALLKPDRAEPE